MSYMINDRRKQTMLERLGDAAQLIDDQRFLPFYRSIQMKLERDGHTGEWAKMIETAFTKEQPSRYFAKMCKMIKEGTYKFVEAVKEVAGDLKLYVHDKLIKFQFGKYHKYWVRKAQEFINLNGQAGFVDLLEYAERKGISQKYMAAALKNGKSPTKYYRENIIGGAA